MAIKMEHFDIEQNPLTLDAIWTAEWSDFHFDPEQWAKQAFEPAFTVPGGASVSLLNRLEEA
jgi:hypothetical protein